MCVWSGGLCGVPFCVCHITWGWVRPPPPRDTLGIQTWFIRNHEGADHDRTRPVDPARDLDMDTRVDDALAAAGRLHGTGWLTPPEEAGKR